MVFVTEDDQSQNRFSTMSLQTLPNTKNSRRKALNIATRTNFIEDISGAKAQVRYLKYLNRPNLRDNKDIVGTKPNILHRDTNKTDRQLSVEDIDGAKPRPKTFVTDRSVDPLFPHYKLPSFKRPEPVEMKFIRDSIQASDIEGTNPKPLYRFKQRETISVSDIEGAQVQWKPRHEKARKENPPHDIMKVDDISNPGFRSSRVTDPLCPAYDINGMHVEDDPVHSKPKKLTKRKNAPFFSLTTDDIEGSQPGWFPPTILRPLLEERRQFNNTNFIGDIAGAQADTVVHSIKTLRNVNPLNPTYVSLDGEYLKAPMTPLYKDPAIIEAKMAAQVAIERAERSAQIQANGIIPHRGLTAPEQSLDEKDKLINQLEQELHELRLGVPKSNQEEDKEKTNFVPPRSALVSSDRPGTRDTPPSSHSEKQEAGLFLTSASPLALGNTVERLILTSSDGQPRVHMSAAERRAAKVTADDIEAVRNLE